MESSSFSGSLKKAKTPGNIAQVAHCLVDGCNADLSLCRAYHRRHKVCEIHSKTPEVIIGGREQRFCQQCSRFHSLVEFDKGKRSCRKRLDGHNRRRRKPQPESLSRNSGLVFSSQQGTRLLSFSSPQILPSSVANSSWTGIHVKPQNSMMPCNNQQCLNYNERKNSIPECSAHSSYQGMNQLQLTQGGDRAIQETSTCQPFLEPNFALSGSTKIISDRLNQVVDSYCALSLLSSAPTPTPTVSREFGLNHMVETEGPLPQTQSVIHNWLCNNGVGHYTSTQESKPVVSVTDSYGSNASNTVYFQEVFQQGPEGSSTNGTNQTLTFMWE